MAKIKLPYVQEFVRDGKAYRYFRRGAIRIALPGKPGSSEFMTAYADALARSEPEPKTSIGDRTVAHAAKIFTGTMAWRNMAVSTRRGVENVLGRVVAEHGHRSMVTLQRTHLINLRDSMADRPGAARNYLRVMNHLGKVAVDQGWRADNPAEGVKAEYKAAPHVTWTWADVQRFIDHHHDHDGYGSRAVLACMLLLSLGQRRGDVTRMSWRDVQGDMIRVNQAKTGAALELWIRPELMALIDPLPRDAPAFLVTEAGRSFTPAGFGNWFRDRCNEAGLSHLSAHGLRKTAMTAAANAGASAHELMALSGHRTLGMVQHYTRAADQRELASRAGAFPLPIRIGGKDED